MLKRLLAIWGAGVLLIISLFSALATAATAPAGQGLEISPPLVEKNAPPGQKLSFPIRVRNVTKAAVVTHAQVNDFVANGEEGQAKVLTSGEPSPYSFIAWVEPIPDLSLAAGEAKTTTVTIDTPTNASPGGHYGVIRFTGTPQNGGGTSVSLTASVGTLVLLDVPGKQTISASLIDFYTTKNGQKASAFEYGPVGFVERIQNSGNVHIQPIGTVRVTNTFGRQVAVLSVNPNGGNILPASIRRFEQVLPNKHLFGYYKAEANITYNGQTMNKNLSFWVIPYKMILIVLGAIIIVVALVRANTKRAVKKATRGSGDSSKSKK